MSVVNNKDTNPAGNYMFKVNNRMHFFGKL